MVDSSVTQVRHVYLHSSCLLVTWFPICHYCSINAGPLADTALSPVSSPWHHLSSSSPEVSYLHLLTHYPVDPAAGRTRQCLQLQGERKRGRIKRERRPTRKAHTTSLCLLRSANVHFFSSCLYCISICGYVHVHKRSGNSLDNWSEYVYSCYLLLTEFCWNTVSFYVSACFFCHYHIMADLKFPLPSLNRENTFSQTLVKFIMIIIFQVTTQHTKQYAAWGQLLLMKYTLESL